MPASSRSRAMPGARSRARRRPGRGRHRPPNAEAASPPRRRRPCCRSPTPARSTSATAVLVVAPSRATPTPHARTPAANAAAKPAGARQADRCDSAQNAADAEGAVEIADTRVSQVEDVDGEHDREDGECAGDHRLGGVRDGDCEQCGRRRRACGSRPAYAERALVSRWRPRPSGSSAARRSPRRARADHRNAVTQTTNTPGVPLTASTIPPMPGPRKMLALSIVPATAFDAVSSTGVAASVGVSAACAGPEGRPDDGDGHRQRVHGDDRRLRLDENGDRRRSAPPGRGR